MRVAAQLGRLAPRHQQQLGVRLQADHPVHDLRAHGLQPLGPIDVGLFLEARLQLDDAGDFLAAPRRLDQQIHQRRFGAGAINRLLDRQHVGVVHGLVQELHHRVERLERVVQQHVTAPQLLEDRLLAHQRGRPGRRERREAQRRRVGLVDQLVQPHQVHRAVHAVQRAWRQAELLEQELHQFAWAGVDDFEADRLAEVARRQGGAQRLAQVCHVVFVDFEVGVARHAKLRERLDLAPREQFAQVGPDHAGEQHERLAVAAEVRGQPDDTRQDPRYFDDRDRIGSAERVFPSKPGDEVERLVRDLRERVRRVEPHGHEQRAHLVVEELRDPAHLRRRALRMADDANALLRQRRHHLFVENGVLPVDQGVCVGGNRRNVARGNAAAAAPRRFNVVGKAHFEEFVHVGRHDAHIAQPFEQRHVGALRLREHAPVEFESGTLAIQQLRHR